VVAIIMALPLCQTSAVELPVFATASLTDAMKEITAKFEKQSGIRKALNFDGSSLLARQSTEGAPPDVFVSAYEAKMDQLQRRGLIDKTSRRDPLGNALDVVTAADSRLTITSPADLLQTGS